ncbi:MAG TPA: hypothetical protein ENG81_01110 [Candidatus Bathyarchaeota archaeon]|nr:hypothetical protein [Candidatus Bathyarchaeota archaeon]
MANNLFINPDGTVGGTKKKQNVTDITQQGSGVSSLVGGNLGNIFGSNKTVDPRATGITPEQSNLTATAGLTAPPVPTNASKLSDLPPTPEISTETLGTQTTPITVPTPEVTPAPTITPPPPPTPAPPAPPEEKTDPYALLKEYQDNLQAPSSTADAFEQAQKGADILAKQEVANQINAQITGVINEGRQAKLQLESSASGKNVTTSFLGRQQQEIDRQTAIKALPLQMQAEIANNNLSAAQSHLETLFKLKSDDATNMMNFRNKQAETIYNVATAEQKNQIDAKIREENREFQVQQANITNARNVANSILSNQPQLASQMSQIDWASPTAQADFAKLQAQVSKDPMLVLDRKVKEAQLRKINAEIAGIGQPSASELKAINEAIRNAEASIPVATAKVKTVDELLVHRGMAGTVGAYGVTRWTPFTIDKADKQSFAGEVHRLVSGLSLDSLIDAKSRGATFGALSDREMTILSNAATAINDWEIKDKNGVGKGRWAIDEASFKVELNRIKDLTNQALLRYQGSLFNQEEQSLLDNIYNNQEASVYY